MLNDSTGIHKDLLARHRAVLPSWMSLYYDEPISIVNGDGRYVWDAEGNQYLDFFGGILVTMSGYNIPEIIDAIKTQAEKMLHTSTLYLIESQIELAEKIAELSEIPNAKVFFTNSGSEANDAALMMASMHRGSNQILAMRGSYHGRSHSTIGVTGNRSWSPTQSSPFHTVYVHGSYPYRSPFSHLEEQRYIEAAVQDLRDLLSIAVSGPAACLIVEPIQGLSGFSTPPDGLFKAFKEVLDEEEILFISDEVQTGWGRTGEYFWGYQAHGITPDILTFAKGIGNGLAISGVVGKAELIDTISTNSISTFGGNPLATAGALANLDYALEHNLQSNAAKIGQQLMVGLTDLSRDLPAIGEVRGKGLMIGIEFVTPGTKNPDANISARVMEETKKRGLLVGKGGLYSNAIRIAPPLSLTKAEAMEGLQIMSNAIRHATSC